MTEIRHLFPDYSDRPKGHTLCGAVIWSEDLERHSMVFDVREANCDDCVDKYNKITGSRPFSKVVDCERDADGKLIAMLEDERIVEIDVWSLAGPGCQRRVLWQLELLNGKDLDHLSMADYAWDALVAPWHY